MILTHIFDLYWYLHFSVMLAFLCKYKMAIEDVQHMKLGF